MFVRNNKFKTNNQQTLSQTVVDSQQFEFELGQIYFPHSTMF